MSGDCLLPRACSSRRLGWSSQLGGGNLVSCLLGSILLQPWAFLHVGLLGAASVWFCLMVCWPFRLLISWLGSLSVGAVMAPCEVFLGFLLIYSWFDVAISFALLAGSLLPLLPPAASSWPSFLPWPPSEPFGITCTCPLKLPRWPSPGPNSSK